MSVFIVRYLEMLPYSVGTDLLRCGYRTLATVVVIACLGPMSAASALAQQGSQGANPATRPLKSIMVSLGHDMSLIADGLWREDYVMVHRGADGIAGHARVPPEQMEAIKDALGDRFQSFVALDRTVHDASVEMAAAAARHDLQAVRVQYRRVQDGCISCHSAFREEVRQRLRQEATP